jgi:hypothetical protein
MAKRILVINTDYVAIDISDIRELHIIEVSDEAYDREFKGKNKRFVLGEYPVRHIDLTRGGFDDEEILSTGENLIKPNWCCDTCGCD